MGEVFPLNVPGRVGNGTLQERLRSRLSRVDLLVAGQEVEDLAGAGFDLAVERIVEAMRVARFEWDPPVADDRARSSHTYRCDSPMCFEARRPGGSRSHTHTRKMYHATIHLRSGDPELLRYAPPGSYQALDPDEVHSSGSSIIIRFGDGDAARAKTLLGWLESSLRAVNELVDEHNANLYKLVAGRLERRRASLRAGRQTVEETGFAIGRPPAPPAEYRIPDKRRPRRNRSSPARSDEIDYQLSREDFASVLECIETWRDSSERLPGVASGSGEDQLRNSLLAALRARFFDGTGEAFSVAGKTDLRILVRTADGGEGPQVFHAECKIWRGPSSVEEAMEQLVERYSTHRDRLGALVFFIVDRAKPDEVPDTAVKHLTSHHGAVEIAPVRGWRVVRVSDPKQPERTIELAVVTVAIPQANDL